MASIRQLDRDGDLFDGAERRLRMVQAYYDALLEHDGFRSALIQLFSDLAPEIEADRRDGGTPPSSDYEAVLFGSDHAAALVAIHTETCPATLRAAIEAFAARWLLPYPDGVIDLWAAARWRQVDDPPIVRVSFRAEMKEMPPGGRIIPQAPEAFHYDPTHHSREWLAKRADDMAEAVRSDILRQATGFRNAAKDDGWTPIGTWHRSDADLQRLARRLRRRTLEGLTWLAIAKAEANDGYEWPQESSIQNSVKSWAATFAIERPRRRAGRPRNGTK